MALFLKVSTKLAMPLFTSEIILGITKVDDQPLLLLKKESHRELQFQAGFQSLTKWKKKCELFYNSFSTLRKNTHIHAKRYRFFFGI